MGSQSNQPKPVPNQRQGVWHDVIEVMKQRNEFGRKKYGVELQPFNGRDALVDAFEENLDLVVYLKQAIIEQEEIKQMILDVDENDSGETWIKIVKWAQSGGTKP